MRGIVGPGKLSKAFVEKKVLQDLTSNTDKITMVYVKVDDPKNIPAAIAGLKKSLPDYQIYSMEEFLSLITPDNVPGLNAFIANDRRARRGLRFPRGVPRDVYGRTGADTRDRDFEGAWRIAWLHHRNVDA